MKHVSGDVSCSQFGKVTLVSDLVENWTGVVRLLGHSSQPYQGSVSRSSGWKGSSFVSSGADPCSGWRPSEWSLRFPWWQGHFQGHGISILTCNSHWLVPSLSGFQIMSCHPLSFSSPQQIVNLHVELPRFGVGMEWNGPVGTHTAMEDSSLPQPAQQGGGVQPTFLWVVYLEVEIWSLQKLQPARGHAVRKTHLTNYWFAFTVEIDPKVLSASTGLGTSPSRIFPVLDLNALRVPTPSFVLTLGLTSPVTWGLFHAI